MSVSGIRSYLPSFLGGTSTATTSDIYSACAQGDLKAVQKSHQDGVDLKKPNEIGLLPISVR